jgi:hypothetical protein
MTHSKNTIPEGLCQCGCGERARARFVNGHGGAKAPFYAVDPDTGCWVWQRNTSGLPNNRYGYLKRNGKRIKAHRFFWEQVNGPVPDGLELHHRCENRLCVNPDHLEAVTHRHNIYVSKKTKLSDEQIAEIRRLASTTMQKDIAKRFGVSRPCISNIVRGKTRNHR